MDDFICLPFELPKQCDLALLFDTFYGGSVSCRWPTLDLPKKVSFDEWNQQPIHTDSRLYVGDDAYSDGRTCSSPSTSCCWTSSCATGRGRTATLDEVGVEWRCNSDNIQSHISKGVKSHDRIWL